MIVCERVVKQYTEQVKPLRDVNFVLPSGEMAFLTGHSGAGKTTLLNLLTGIEKPTAGKVVVGNVALNGLSHREMALFRRKIGIVFQNYKLLPYKNVFENVALPLKVCGFSAKEIVQRVHAALETVKLLDKAFEMPAVLSGGEQQRVGIARAVVNRPSVLLADEPTGNLDFDLALDIIGLFERFNEAGVTVLIATHNEALIDCYRYRVLKLASGVLVKEEVTA